MQARSPLMIEHRLIEKMIALIRQTLSQTDKEKKIDPAFVDIAIDFFHTYADRTHHGKEEDILFRDLNKKDLREEDRRLMNELIEEHISGRRIAQRIFEANSRYRNGDEPALKEIASQNFIGNKLRRKTRNFSLLPEGIFQNRKTRPCFPNFGNSIEK
jgi:hemerythrin-like domain-containing protein